MSDEHISKKRTVIKLSDNTDTVDVGSCKGAHELWYRADEVIVPDGVSAVDQTAFAKCYELEKVILPSGLKTIGYSAFNLCTKLKSIDLPDGLEFIECDAFRNCSSLDDITIPQNVIIGVHAFYDCVSLKNVKMNYPVKVFEVRYKSIDMCEGDFQESDFIDKVVTEISNEEELCEHFRIFMGSPFGKYLYDKYVSGKE